MKSYDLQALFVTIEKALSLAWGEKWGTFIKAYPDGDINKVATPIITYRLKSKKPQEMKSVREIKPRIRAEVPGIDASGQKDVTQYWGQRFECILEFGIWSNNEKEASELADKFEEFMLTYCGTFKELGLVECIYMYTTDENPPMSWPIDLKSRFVYYMVVIDKLTIVSTNSLRAFKIQLLNSLNEDEVEINFLDG